jgi:S1-C subfamily serine protease
MKLQFNGSNRPLFLAAALAALLSTAAVAADITQSARDLFTRTQPSLVSVSAMSKMDMSGSGLPMRGLGDAQETACVGLVVDASGLTVVSYTALNPIEAVMGALRSRMGGDEEESSAGKPTTELSRIQMRLADGTEVPARLVFKDKELDMAFLVPDPKEGEKAPTFTPVSLAAGATARELDDIVVLGRQSKTLGYQPTVSVGHVTAVVSKPRTMYDLSTPAQPGTPIFLPDGKLLGLTATMAGEARGLLSGGMEQLVLPTAEIAKLAEQAKKAAAKKDEKKADEKKAESKDQKAEDKK